MEQQVETPISAPLAPMTLREHIAAEDASVGGALTPKPVETPVIEDPVDPEVEKEIDALQAPEPEETPAQKRARTIANREKAEKAIKTRLANQRDEARQKAERLEREITELRRTAPVAAPAAAPQAAKPVTPVYDGADPNDPEPTLEAFGDKPDPFVEWTRAHSKWSARVEVRKSDYARDRASRSEAATQSRVAALRAFDAHATELRKTEPTFDAAINDLELSRPMQDVIFSAGELGPHLALHLAKDSQTHSRLLTLPPAQQYVELGIVKAAVTAARTKAAAPPPPPVTSAPAPPSQTVGGVSAATVPDTRKGVPFKDHVRIENEREAEARREGRRY